MNESLSDHRRSPTAAMHDPGGQGVVGSNPASPTASPSQPLARLWGICSFRCANLTGQDLPVDPYSQAALDPGGWHCETVSARHLPAHRWMLDELAVVRGGWRCPDGDTDNWWRPDVPLNEAAALLVDASWCARGCIDQDRYAISVGTFPSGPDGGLPMPTTRDPPLAA